MPRIDNEHTFQMALLNGVNLFLGAGFSVLARNKSGSTLPVGPDLKKILVENFDMRAVESLDLAQLCTIIEASRAAELRGFFEKTFQVNGYDPRYKVFEQFKIENIFTTNVDDLVYQVFAASDVRYVNDVTQKGPARKDKAAINYVPLHGSVQNRSSKLIFATTDMAAAFAADPDLWHLLTNQMQQTPTLFWGYSLADAGVLQALSPQTVKGRGLKERWIVLREANPAAEQYFKALRFNVIVADTSELLDYLSGIRAKVTTPAPTEPTEKLFPEESIPSLGSGVVRPLLDFYLGDAPTWPDIYSGRLHKTRHVGAVLNAINGRRNVVVIGIPACGKTTLLMQCAVDADFPGHKLVSNSLTGDKAKFVIGRLGGAAALIFVDDFAESIEAVSLLMAEANITVVAFEREHNFEMISHKLDRRRYDLIDVTEVLPDDIQDIYSRIPPEIRTQGLQGIRMQQGVQPSLFEVVEASINRPTLKRRFAQVLQELSAEPELHDLLVMIAYVHACRTPVSFDMAYAFLRDRISGYDDVYGIVGKLGQLISSYADALVDADQDYYVPRSAIISEAIVDQVSGAAFRRVLERFHREVSTFRICRFDVFKRRAFDADFFGRAFPDWREGQSFYDELYERDNSPYLRQQGALYLAHKKRYREAFAWIDEALLKSAGRVPSIRHTHAIILFNANVDSAGGAEKERIRALLDQSMEILTECYRYDKRKSYHAITFADQARRYWDVYGDKKAEEYLRKALKWLEDENRQSPWHRRVRDLLGRVRDTLRTIGK